jgi:hypothetical protein
VAEFGIRSVFADQGAAKSGVLVIALMVFAIAPLTYPGFFQTHSGFLPAFNAVHPSDAPNWGRFPDPLRGEGKLPYLLVWPFWQLTASGAVAVKWGYALAFLLGALGTYAWTRAWLGARGAVLSTAIYTYLPWHLSTVYVRGAYAEAWLWAILPFTLWALDQLAHGRALAAWVTGLLSVLAALWTQTGLALLWLPLLAVYNLVITRRGQALINRLAGTTACLLGALWLLVGPDAPQAPLSFADHGLYPFQLLSSFWGSGVSVPGWADGISFQLGLVAVGLSGITLALWLGERTSRSGRGEDSDGQPSGFSVPISHALAFWAVVLALLVGLTLRPLAFCWRITGLETLLTYPWQLLGLTGLPLAFLAGAFLRVNSRLANLSVWAGLLALTILASYPYLAPRFTQLDPGPNPLAALQPVGAKEPQIYILDHDIVPPTEITPTLTLTLTWQAVTSVADDYTVFVHVLTPDGAKIAQRDTRPCDGECPTDGWLPGEIVIERHQLTLAPDAPPGPYRLAVGLYLLETGDRAAVMGRDDRTVFFHVP